MVGAGGSWIFSARKWFTGPVINLSNQDADNTNLEKDKSKFDTSNDEEGHPAVQKSDNSSITNQKEHKNNDGVEVSEVEKINE